MKLTKLLRATALIGSAFIWSAGAGAGETTRQQDAAANADAHVVKFQQIRNATIKLNYAGTTFLVDPMLAAKGAYKGFEGTERSHLRNPLIDLPMPVSEVLKADAIVLTHLHDDHWDQAARNLVPRDMTIFTQNAEDAAAVQSDGFTDVRVLTEAGSVFNGTRLYKTGGKHGTDQMYAVPQLGKILGEAMGIVFQRSGHQTTYVVGDTVWNQHVDRALAQYKPDVIVLNTGYAKVNGFNESIIMGKDDMLRAYQVMPKAKIVAIHMDTVNHAMLSRTELRAFIDEKKLEKQRALVPNDGESYGF